MHASLRRGNPFRSDFACLLPVTRQPFDSQTNPWRGKAGQHEKNRYACTKHRNSRFHLIAPWITPLPARQQHRSASPDSRVTHRTKPATNLAFWASFDKRQKLM